MIKLFRKTIFLSILPILFSCKGFSPEPEIYDPNYTPEIGVFGLISNDEDFEFVIVERTLTLEEENRIKFGVGNIQINTIIKNATVSIYDEFDTTYFSFYQQEPSGNYFWGEYLQKGIYLDREQKFLAKPGKTYKLKVEIPGKKTITGTAKMPVMPKITTPVPNSRIQKYSLYQAKLNWQDHLETAAYQLFVIIKASEENYSIRHNVLYDYIVNKPPATLNEIDAFFINDLNYFSKIVTLKVIALDRNYFDYKRSHSGFSSITGSYVNTVENGIGILGAVTVDSVDVVLY